MRETRHWHVDVSLMVVALAWGSTYWVAKELVTTETVLSLLAVRMVLAALGLAVVVGLRGRRLRRDELQVGVVLGLLLAAVFLTETFGVAATSATNAGLIISLTIVMTPLLEKALGGSPLSRWFYLAALVAVVGVALLSSGGLGGGFGVGDALMLAAAAIRAVHVVTMHRRSSGTSQDSLNLTLVQVATCGVVFLAAASLGPTPVPTYVASLGTTALVQLGYLVVGCTVFPFLVQMWAVRRTSPTRVSLLLGTEPVWAAVIGVTLAGDAFGVAGAVGIVLVVLGVQWGQVIESRRRTDDGPADEGASDDGPADEWGADEPAADEGRGDDQRDDGRPADEGALSSEAR